MEEEKRKELLSSLDENLANLRVHFLNKVDYQNFVKTLTDAKLIIKKIEPPTTVLRKEFVRLMETILELMKDMVSCIKEPKLKQIKAYILEMFLKIIGDPEYTEIDRKILDILFLIISKDVEELGQKSLKLILECLKGHKDTFRSKIIIEFSKLVSISFRNIRTILKKNFELEDKKISGNQDSTLILLSCESFKVILELTNYVNYFVKELKQFSEQCFNNLLDSLKPFLKDLIEPPEFIDERTDKSYILEEYLQLISKGLFFLNSFQDIYKKNIEGFGPTDYIKVLKFVIVHSNLKETRREIFSQFKYYKDIPELFIERAFFINEKNYIHSDIMYSDSNINDIIKFIIAFEETFYKKLKNDEEKCEILEKFISRINDFRLNYDLKQKIFFSIEEKFGNLVSNANFRKDKKFLLLNDYLIEQLGDYYQSIARAMMEMENFFMKDEKRAKSENLTKNMMEVSFAPPDPKKLQWKNVCFLFEILLNNEFEKYSLTEEVLSLKSIFDLTNKILEHVSKVLQTELVSLQNYNYNQITHYQQLINRNENFGGGNQDLFERIQTKAFNLSKLLYNFLLLYERFIKSHKHQKDEESSSNNDSSLIDTFFTFPSPLIVHIFKISMPKIFNLICFNFKICPTCPMIILIDKIFNDKIFKSSTSSDINSIIQLRKDLFEIYFDYFSSKIYEVGNSKEDFNQSTSTYSNLSMTIIINIIKQLFKYLSSYTGIDSIKFKITSLLISCIILSKKSEYFGNYVYIIRCLFKNIGLQNQVERRDYEFHKEALHLVYGIMKHMINLKSSFPFLKEMITEIILIIPLKLKYLIDFTHLFLPSLIDSLSMNNDIIQVGFQLFEQWMNGLFHKPEVVEPFLQKNILQLTTILTSHLYKNVNISLNSLKLLSKLGGKSRNYLEDKGINFKTCPTQILIISLENKTTRRKLDFPVDNIIDICVKLVTKKISASSSKKSMAIFKSCILTFFDKEINYDYILRVKENIINNVNSQEKQFDSEGYFKHFHKGEQIKINSIYRRSEQFLFEKILRGLFLCFAMSETEQESKEFFQFICDYFVIAMIAKDKNNKYINALEIDPIIIFDIILEFFFSTNPTVLRNTSQASTTVSAKKLVLMIIDTIEKIFDKNYKVIAHLEIIDIMYRKFLNFCYNNEWPKKGIGLILIDIVISRFSKEITYKYLDEIFRVIFFIASGHPSIIEIKSKSECKKVLQALLDIFLIDDPNFSKLTPEMITGDMEIDDDELAKSKQNFIMMYTAIKASSREILQNIDSNSQFEINLCSDLIKRLFNNNIFKNNAALVFMCNELSLADFAKMYYNHRNDNSCEEIFSKTLKSEVEDLESGYFSQFSQYSSLKKMVDEKNLPIHKKLLSIISALTTKVGLTEENFTPLLSNAMGLIFCMKYIPEYVVNYVFETKDHVEIFLLMVKSVYEALLSDIFTFIKVSKYIKDFYFLLKYKSIIMERLYLEKKIKFPFKLDDLVFTEAIPEEAIERVEKFVTLSRRENWTESSKENNNDSSQNDAFASEFFPKLNEKMKMLKYYIKLLQLIFNNKKINRAFESNVDLGKSKIKFSLLKIKSVDLMVSYIMIREENKLLKASKKFLSITVTEDQKIKDILNADRDLKECVRNIINNFKIEKDLTLVKQIDVLLLLFKSCSFGQDIFEDVRKKFEAIRLMESQTNNLERKELFNDNILLGYYSFISLFAYFKHSHVVQISNEIIFMLTSKEKDASLSKGINSFTLTKYKSKIIKLIYNLRNEFTNYLIEKCHSFNLDWFLVRFFKKIIEENKSYLIRETVGQRLIQTLENEIGKENSTNKFVTKNLLRLFVIVAKKAPILLGKNEVMEKIHEFYCKNMKNLSEPANKQIKSEIEKYVVKIFMLYLKSFNNNNHYAFYLLHYYSRTANQSLRNKIIQFVTIDLFSRKTMKTYKKIMKSFVFHFENLFDLGCFDPVVKYLIIPMTIKYFKETAQICFQTNTSREEAENHKEDCLFFFERIRNITDKLLGKKSSEKKSIEKWKLFSLIIMLFAEYSETYSETKSTIVIERKDELNSIFNQIKQIAKLQYLKDKQITSKVLWILNACLITILLEKKNNEKHLESVTTFFKDVSDEDWNISSLTYQLIFPLSVDGFAFNSLLSNLIKERGNPSQLTQLFNLMLKYPSILQYQSNYIIGNTTFFLWKICQTFFSYALQTKKLIVQLIGLVMKSLSIQNSPKDQEPERLKLRTTVWMASFKIFYQIFVSEVFDQEKLELFKRYLTYVREFLSKDIEFPQLDAKIEKIKRSYLHCYVYLLKIYTFKGNKNLIYDRLENYFIFLKRIIENNSSLRVLNDFGFIIRMILDEEAFDICNENEKKEEKSREWRAQLFHIVKRIVEGVNQKKKPKVCDINFDSLHSEQEINQFYACTSEIYKQNKFQTPDKLVSSFNITDFKFFILYKRYFDSLSEKDIKQKNASMSLGLGGGNIVSTASSVVDGGPGSISPRSNAETVISTSRSAVASSTYSMGSKTQSSKDSQDLPKILANITSNYFENFYCFSQIYIELVMMKSEIDGKKVNEWEYKTKGIYIKECIDYFTNNKSFYTNLKEAKDLLPIKTEVIDCVENEEPQNMMKTLENYFIVIPETILCGINFFITSKEIMSHHLSRLNDLMVKAYYILKDKVIYNSILEHLIVVVLYSPMQTTKSSKKLLFDILNLHDFISSKKNLSLINIACDYLEKYASNPENSKLDSTINHILRMVVYLSHGFDLKTRKRVIKIFNRYRGKELINVLKWIFTFSDWGGQFCENCTFWLSFSVDMILSCFKGSTLLETKDKCLSKLYNLCFEETANEMFVENDVCTKNDELDKEGKIKEMVTLYNSFLTNRLTKNLMNPIRDVILTEQTLSLKILNSLLPQVWKMLRKSEREELTSYINEFLENLIKKGKGFSIIKSLIESFSNFYPLLRISPEIILTLTKTQNNWTSSFFYLENLFIANIDKEVTYHSLVKILDMLQENKHASGLKYYMSQNAFSISAISNLQCGNYQKAEEVLCKAFESPGLYSEELNYYSDNSVGDYFSKVDLSIWQSGLIECYQNTNRWNQVISLTEEFNNANLKTEAKWYSGNLNWKEIDVINGSRSQYISQINQIYMIMSSGENSQYQIKCMNCIKTIYQDFITFPPSLEKLDYYYFRVFQLIVEAWESTNTLREAEKNINERKTSDFRENLAMWRDRLPHVCEGFKALKSILEPRNYLFNFLKSLIGEKYKNLDEANNVYSNISDKAWNDLMLIKYARKLKLYEVFIDYVDQYNHEFGKMSNMFVYVNYKKNMEILKFIRQISHNYNMGVELSDKFMKEVEELPKTPETKVIESSFLSQKAYFLYKQGNIVKSNDLFQKAASLNSTDYHTYYDWAEMSENVAITMKGESQYEDIWFENAIVNYLMSIIFKLDKAKYIIPKILTLLKQFENQNLGDKLNLHISNVASWVWIFWLPVLFEDFKHSLATQRQHFFYIILKSVTEAYPQSIYYFLNIYENDHTMKLEERKKLSELIGIIRSKDKLNHIIEKIKIMINEIAQKQDWSSEEALLCSINKLDVHSLDGILKNINSLINALRKENIGLMTQMADGLSEVTNQRNVKIFTIFEKLKEYRYYLHSKLITENNYQDLKRIVTNKLYNTRFEGVEIPGLYSNKIVEPSEENRVCIYRFESEYNYKFFTFLSKKILIRGTNDKVFNFTLSKESYDSSSEIKVSQLQTLLNFIFSKNKDTYEQKVKFNTPIKYFLTNTVKITQEEASQYYLNEVFEFCMQKNGYDPEIAYSIYEEENYQNKAISYHSQDIKEKMYKKMCQIVPLNSLKSFIHKFIVSGDEIFIFRKQFATSYGLNSIFGGLFDEWVTLNKISFNKETGSVTFHDMKCKCTLPEKPEKSDKLFEKKIQIRLSKNISYFLTPSCLYGVIPSVIYATVNSIVEKEEIFRKILNCSFVTNVSGRSNKRMSYIEANAYVDNIMKIIHYVRNTDNDGQPDQHPLKIIFEIINSSMDDENLKNKPPFWDPWF